MVLLVLLGLSMPPTRATGVTVTVPPGIVSDCSATATDQSRAINAWLAGLPSGPGPDAPTTALFGRDACYRLDLPILVHGKSNVVFDGNGATFRRFRSDLGAVAPHPYSMYQKGYPFWSVGATLRGEVNRNVVVRNMKVVGLNTISDVTVGFEPERYGGGWTVGSGPSLVSFEFETGFSFENIVGLTVENLTTDATYGDGILVGSEHPDSLVENATVRNVTIDRNGRQGMTIGTVRGLVVDGARILHSHASGIDVETNSDDGFTTGVEIRNSYINARAVAIAAGGLREISDFYVHDNTIRASSMSWPWLAVGNNPHRTAVTPRPRNWRVTGNTVLQARQSPSIWFEATDDVTVSDNVSPLNYNPNPYVVKYPGVMFVGAGGSLVVERNDFQGAYTAGAVQADSATAPVSACGNRLVPEAAFDQPSSCLTTTTTTAPPATTTTTSPQANPVVDGLAAPTGMTAIVVSPTQVNTGWNAGAGTVPAARFNLYRNGALLRSTPNLNYIDLAAVPDTALSYFVRAVDAAGNLGPASDTVTVTTGAAPQAGLVAPTGLTATVVSPTQVNLGWAPGTGTVATAGFNVYRDSALLKTTTNVNLIDWTASPGAQLTYVVRAFDSAGNLSPPSAAVTVTTPADPKPGLAAPVDLRAVVVSPTQVNLGWTPGEGSVPAVRFNVYRNGVLLTSTSNVNYIDSAAPKGSSLTYVAAAVDAAGNVGPASSPVTVTTSTAGGSATSGPDEVALG